MTSKTLSDIYYNPSHPGSYSGVESLYRSAKNFGFTRKDVKNWLIEQLVYTLHKPARKRWKRNRIIVSSINEQFQADLVDMREFANKNDNYKYILTVIDVFSKYAWAIPIKLKNAKEIAKAFKKIFSEQQPLKLQTDQGREFNNQIVKNLFKKRGIIYFMTKNTDIKCAIVERFNRTLKNRMFRYFTRMGNRRFIDVLPRLVKSYNNSYHKTIRMSPIQVTPENEKLVFKNIYGAYNLRELYVETILNKKKILSKGDKVRKKYTLKPLDRGYYPYWTDSVYNIDDVIYNDIRPLYRVEGRRLYPEEVQRVTATLYRVEKILKTRTRHGKKEHFIKWLNHPSSENSWVLAENVFSTQER